MERRRLSLDESCARECSYRITQCCGPTVHGLSGYACEACLEYIVHRLAQGMASDTLRCSYCATSPAYADHLPEAVCAGCAEQALRTTRSWYELKDA